MKYIKVKSNKWSDPQSVCQNSSGNWVAIFPESLKPNLKEWFIHTILKKHFTFGQPFCVMCGLEELK